MFSSKIISYIILPKKIDWKIVLSGGPHLHCGGPQIYPGSLPTPDSNHVYLFKKTSIIKKKINCVVKLYSLFYFLKSFKVCLVYKQLTRIARANEALVYNKYCECTSKKYVSVCCSLTLLLIIVCWTNLFLPVPVTALWIRTSHCECFCRNCFS